MDEQKPEEKGKIDSAIEKLLGIFYSKNRTKLYVLLLFIAGLIMRIIAIINMNISADEAIHAVRPIGIAEAGKLVEYGQGSALWYHIQEVFYSILGATHIGSRFASLLFGSFFIILMFLFVKKVFNSEKLGLISAALAAFSPHLIRMTLPEMDMAVMFFAILGALMIFKHLDSGKKSYLFLSSLMLGIGAMIKIYALIFVFSFTIFLIYSYAKKKEKMLGKIILFLGIVLIFCVPTIVHNYLLYKDKGFVDLMTTNILGIAKEKGAEIYGYGLGAGWMPVSDYAGFFFGNQNGTSSPLPGFIIVLGGLLKEDAAILLLGLLGLFFVFKEHKRYFWFFIISFFPIFIYLGSQAAFQMMKHFLFATILLTPCAALFIEKISGKLKKKFPKLQLAYILLIILAFNLLFLGNVFFEGRNIYSKSAESKLISYREGGIQKNSLVIVDSRIYRGMTAWLFNDRNYLESSLLDDAVEESKKYGEAQSIPTYFIECVTDDCGWGTIASDPEFNQSAEEVVRWFANNSQVLKEIDENDNTIYRIYRGGIMINPVILEIAKLTHNINLYPLGYDKNINEVFDSFKIHSLPDRLLYKSSYAILRTSLWLSLITLIYLTYLFIKE